MFGVMMAQFLRKYSFGNGFTLAGILQGMLDAQIDREGRHQLLMEKVAQPKTLVYNKMPLVIKTDFLYDASLQQEVDKQAAKVIDMIIEKRNRDDIQKEI
jgi:hypothetical protein